MMIVYCTEGHTKMDNKVIQSHNVFGFKIFKQLKKGDGAKNTFISPTSIAMALSMLYNGAGGKTKDEIGKVLELNGITLEELNSTNMEFMNIFTKIDPQIDIAIANSIWVKLKYNLKKSFIEEMKKYYNARVESVDFESPETIKLINSWVKENTRGKIESVIHEISIDAFTFLINAIYFKGTWSDQFDKKMTKDLDFSISKGSAKKCPMMLRHFENIKYLEEKEFQAIALPYGRTKRVAMYIFLPQDLSAFIDKLDRGNFEKWIKAFRKTDGDLILPRLKLGYEKILNQILASLGMPTAFIMGATDLKGLLEHPSGQEYIDYALHKSFLEVNEEGTVAAAVTSLGIAGGLEPRKKYFKMAVDHPYFFVIRDDKTGSNLFMGAIEDPSLSQ